MECITYRFQAVLLSTKRHKHCSWDWWRHLCHLPLRCPIVYRKDSSADGTVYTRDVQRTKTPSPADISEIQWRCCALPHQMPRQVEILIKSMRQCLPWNLVRVYHGKCQSKHWPSMAILYGDLLLGTVHHTNKFKADTWNPWRARGVRYFERDTRTDGQTDELPDAWNDDNARRRRWWPRVIYGDVWMYSSAETTVPHQQLWNCRYDQTISSQTRPKLNSAIQIRRQ